MNFLLNPFVIGLLILVSELVINIVVSQLFNFDLGENNISSIILFGIAGMLITAKTKVKMPTVFNLKIVVTYFALVAVIALIPFLGQEMSTLVLVLVLGLMLFMLFLSFLSLSWCQSLMARTYEKQVAIKESADQNNNEGST